MRLKEKVQPYIRCVDCLNIAQGRREALAKHLQLILLPTYLTNVLLGNICPPLPESDLNSIVPFYPPCSHKWRRRFPSRRGLKGRHRPRTNHPAISSSAWILGPHSPQWRIETSGETAQF